MGVKIERKIVHEFMLTPVQNSACISFKIIIESDVYVYILYVCICKKEERGRTLSLRIKNLFVHWPCHYPA